MLTDFQNSFVVVFSEKFATQNPCHIAHHTLDVSLHYLAKDKKPIFVKFCCT